MLFKLLNPINIIKLLSLLIKKNLDFIKDEYLDRKFYNINYLVKQLFIFDEKMYEKYKKNSVLLMENNFEEKSIKMKKREIY